MIDVSERVITWQHGDDVAMLRILGIADLDELGESAMERDRRVPRNDSVLLAAHGEGLELSNRARQALKRAVAKRRYLRDLRRGDDSSGHPKHKPHQRVATTVIAAAGMIGEPNFLLADDPGVGKTAVAIYLACAFGGKRILVLTRNAAKEQWAREIKRWSSNDLPIRVVDGTIDEQAAIIRKRGWIIAHHEAMVHCAVPMVEEPWDYIILDEAHHISNRNAQRSRTATLLEGRRIALTGHPFAKAPDELFSILRWLDEATYGSYWRFFRQHIDAVQRLGGYHKIIGVKDPALLRWEIERFSLRRLFAKVFPDAPPPSLAVLTSELPKRYRKDYEKLKHQLFVELESFPADKPALLIPNVLARVTRLRQFLVDPALIGSKLPSLKYPLAEEMLVDRGKPTVFFTSFEQAARTMAQRLRKRYRVGIISGPEKKNRAATQLAFQRGQVDALLVVTQAGGEALNLGGFGGCGFLDLPWTHRSVEQAIGRVHRPVEGTGELVPASATAFITKDTYEMRIYDRIRDRGRMFNEVFTVSTLKELLFS